MVQNGIAQNAVLVEVICFSVNDVIVYDNKVINHVIGVAVEFKEYAVIEESGATSVVSEDLTVHDLTALKIGACFGLCLLTVRGCAFCGIVLRDRGVCGSVIFRDRGVTQ